MDVPTANTLHIATEMMMEEGEQAQKQVATIRMTSFSYRLYMAIYHII